MDGGSARAISLSLSTSATTTTTTNTLQSTLSHINLYPTLSSIHIFAYLTFETRPLPAPHERCPPLSLPSSETLPLNLPEPPNLPTHLQRPEFSSAYRGSHSTTSAPQVPIPTDTPGIPPEASGSRRTRLEHLVVTPAGVKHAADFMLISVPRRNHVQISFAVSPSQSVRGRIWLQIGPQAPLATDLAE
ncbi:hypothetical protein B0H14DRAFT_3434637 [Mycena olivaceomarginata]|nr:hypothetical protein B0H14DRAFT_3434637 [Mycena olivaceomarginata]